jgi:hypothetical protein
MKHQELCDLIYSFTADVVQPALLALSGFALTIFSVIFAAHWPRGLIE